MDKIQKKINRIAKKYKGKKVLIYGAGVYAQMILESYDLSNLDIIGITDKKFEEPQKGKKFGTYKKVEPKKLSKLKYDVILVLLKNIKYIKDTLKTLGKDYIFFDNCLDIEVSKTIQPVGIIDFLGGSFKEYIIENNVSDMLRRIKNDFDENSIKILDQTIKKILHLPDYLNHQYENYDKQFIEMLMSEQDKIDQAKYKKEFKSYQEKYKMTRNEYNYDVFYFHHGLRNVSKKIKDYIKNKAFVDGGAFIGDSAMVLMNYKPSKIYSFEISPKVRVEYEQVMEMNNIEKDKYELVPYGLAEKNMELMFNDLNHQGSSIYLSGKDCVKCVSLDSFFKNKNQCVGFIKADVEGALLSALNGMQKTIEKHRPVLCLAIYHSPQEFFEGSLRLQEITKDLNYKIEMQYQEIWGGFINETVLFAYPKELE